MTKIKVMEEKKDKEEVLEAIEENGDTSKSPDMRVTVVEEETASKEVVPDTQTTSVERRKFAEGIPFWILLLSFLLGLTLGGGLVGGMFYFRNSVNNLPQAEDSLLPTPFDNVSDTTPATNEGQDTEPPAEVDLSELSVNVLNGTGKPGEAKAIVDLLTESGFEQFETGNASKFDFEETLVEVKESVPDSVIDKIKASLIAYVLEISEEPLDADSDFDIVITAGSSRN